MRICERWLAALFVFSLACQPDGRAVPPIPADSRAVLWAVRDGESWRVVASEVDENDPWRFSQRFERGTPLAVLAYAETLFNLGLAAGPVDPAAGAQTRGLPAPQTILTAEVDGEDTVRWQTEPALPTGSIAFASRLSNRSPASMPGLAFEIRRRILGVSFRCDTTDVQAPALAAPPVLGPCPTGWSSSTMSDGTPACDPGPLRAEPCPPATFQPPGAVDCQPVGEPCAERFADPPPSVATVLYVDPMASAGGDGSAAAPLTTVLSALARTDGSATAVLLAPGDYPETIELPDGVTLVGACPARVRVGGASVASDVQAGLRKLSIRATVRVSGELDLTGVVVEAGPGAGVFVDAAGTARLTDSRISADDAAVDASADATVILTNSTLSAAVAVMAQDRATVSAAQVAIRDVLQGLVVGAEASVDAVAMLAESGGSAVLTDSAGARVSIEAGVMRGFDGAGVIRSGAGQIELRRVRISDSAVHGAVVSGGSVQVVDGVISGIRSNPTLGGGWGVRVDDGRFTGTRLRIVDVRHIGLRAEGRTAVGRLVDTVVEDVAVAAPGAPQPGRALPAGLQAQEGGSLDLERVEIRRVVREGISTRAADDSAQVSGRDLTIEDISPQAGGTRGVGITVDDGTPLVLDRVRVARAHLYGIELRDTGTNGELTDVIVSDTATIPCSAAGCMLGNGVGIAVLSTAQLALRRFDVRGNADAGFRFDATLAVTLADGTVQGHPVGLFVSDPVLPLEQLVDGVRFIDNETNVRVAR